MKQIKSPILVDGTVSADTPTLDEHLATKAYVDSAVPDVPPVAGDSDQIVLSTQIFT